MEDQSQKQKTERQCAGFERPPGNPHSFQVPRLPRILFPSNGGGGLEDPRSCNWFAEKENSSCRLNKAILDGIEDIRRHKMKKMRIVIIDIIITIIIRKIGSTYFDATMALNGEGQS